MAGADHARGPRRLDELHEPTPLPREVAPLLAIFVTDFFLQGLCVLGNDVEHTALQVHRLAGLLGVEVVYEKLLKDLGADEETARVKLDEALKRLSAVA